jgi:hypothetical protein
MADRLIQAEFPQRKSLNAQPEVNRWGSSY